MSIVKALLAALVPSIGDPPKSTAASSINRLTAGASTKVVPVKSADPKFNVPSRVVLLPRLPVKVRWPPPSISSTLLLLVSATGPRIALLPAAVVIVKSASEASVVVLPRRFRSPTPPVMLMVRSAATETPPPMLVSVARSAVTLSPKVSEPLVVATVKNSSRFVPPIASSETLPPPEEIERPWLPAADASSAVTFDKSTFVFVTVSATSSPKSTSPRMPSAANVVTVMFPFNVVVAPAPASMLSVPSASV